MSTSEITDIEAGVAAAVTDSNFLDPSLTGSISDAKSDMYKAALKGDWLAAEKLLQSNPTLATAELTRRGDRALHIATAMKHEKFIQELVQRVEPSALELLDGNGYTACCYAATSGETKLVDLMIRRNPKLRTTRDKNNATPLHKAVLGENKEMISCRINSINFEDLREWFDLLVVTIESGMYDVALNLLEKNERLATMKNEDGTVLHLLARQDTSSNIGIVDIMTMLTNKNPHLLWEIDNKGYTIVHLAVIHRQENLFGLIHKIGGMKDLIAISQDENGNNILHLAAKLAPSKRNKGESLALLEMQKELEWFKKVEEIVPALCVKMRNKKGQTPRELFSLQHKTLLIKSITGMKNTSNSGMLIATIMFTEAFAAVFTPPDRTKNAFSVVTRTPPQRNDIQDITDILLYGSFYLAEGLSMLGSFSSITMFLTIMTSTFEEDQFLLKLPWLQKIGFIGLRVSIYGAFGAFSSAYFLVYDADGILPGLLAFLFFVMMLALWSNVISSLANFIFETLHTLVISNIAASWGRTNELFGRRVYSLVKRE